MTRLFTHSRTTVAIAACISAIPFGSSEVGATVPSLDLQCPIQVVASGHPVVQVKVGGRQTFALLDTAASRSVISTALKNELGLSPSAITSVSGMTGSSYVDSVSGVSVDVCGVDFRPEEMSVVDLQGLLGDAATPVGVVLGNDYLLAHPVSLDFAGERLMRLRRDDAAHRRWIDLKLSRSGRITVPSKIENVSATATLDTGSAAALYISQDLFQRLRNARMIKYGDIASMGIEGLSVDKVFILKQFSLAGYSFFDVPTQVPSSWHDDSDAVIGMPILTRLSVAIDPQKRVISFSANRKDLTREFIRDRSGMNVRRLPGKLEVVYVSSDGPAARAGLKAGDVIVSIDGSPISQSLLRSRPRMGSEAVGTVQRLGLSDGTIRTLRLDNYF